MEDWAAPSRWRKPPKYHLQVEQSMSAWDVGNDRRDLEIDSGYIVKIVCRTSYVLWHNWYKRAILI
jgi:hypothetical protein